MFEAEDARLLPVRKAGWPALLAEERIVPQL
jgi:hypothetical protein